MSRETCFDKLHEQEMVTAVCHMTSEGNIYSGTVLKGDFWCFST